MSLVSQQVESPLGRWTMTEWRPAHLAGLVEFLWHFDGQMTFPRERVFPKGFLEIIVHLGELSGFSPREFLAAARYAGSTSIAEAAS